VIGDHSLARAAEAWAEFKRTRCAGLAPATVERFRAILQAAINYGAAEETWAQVRAQWSRPLFPGIVSWSGAQRPKKNGNGNSGRSSS